MVMQAEPVYRAYTDLAARIGRRPRLVYLTPQGKTFTQQMAKELALEEDLVFLCGHYEGVDQRVIDEIVDEEISIGDYVLTGGELGALVVVDAVGRLCEGVLADESCYMDESHYNGCWSIPITPVRRYGMDGRCRRCSRMATMQDRPVAPGKDHWKHLAQASGSAPDSAADR